MRTLALSTCLLASCLTAGVRGDVTLNLSAATLTLDARGAVTSFTFADGTRWPASRQPVFALEGDGKTLAARSVTRAGDLLAVEFEDGSRAGFRLTERPGLVLFRLESFRPSGPVDRLRLFRLVLPDGAKVGGTLNAGYTDRWVAAVMAAEPNVEASSETTGAYRADRPGCSHRFARSDQARAGRSAAEFTATADAQPGGWSVRGKPLDRTLDLTGCRAVRAWVHGDGQGEQLKIQLYDGLGGYRDSYLPIDFKGWRHVTLTDPPYNTLRYDHVTTLNLYYNGLPPGKSVTCLVDQVEALVARGGKEEAVLLEDFESPGSPFFAAPGATLDVWTHRTHGLQPAAFGILAASPRDFWTTVERFETIAGIPSPRLEGAWNKTSPAIKRSYFFLTDFRPSQFDAALAIARRGRFAMILLGQESWSRGTGHYEIERDRYPDGLDGLKRTIGRFKNAGFKVGLHFLGASIYPPDPYITPVPDRRLVTGAATTLASDVDDKATTLPTTAAPTAFPAEDGGYEGAGTVIRVGDELITYSARSLSAPFGFTNCQRGHLGTKRAAHRKGERVAHLVRAYGYHMYDMDTTLLGEVAAHFARVANACQIDMIYFDGSESLQGDHWYYNARLHKAFLDALENKNILLQASSYSHYSWHLMARSASADGHGDLKGYLDERSQGFDTMARDGMPLDIGWYYGYDPNSTLDQYEYILGATIGYDSSMSYQVSPAAAAKHPFTGPLLDLIRRYETLRLSGRVPDAMRARFRIDPSLGGQKPAAERDRLLDRRREYRLVGPEGHEVFQRVAYGPWRDVVPTTDRPDVWTAKVAEGPAQVGVWIHAKAEAKPGQPGVTDPWIEVGGRRLEWRGTLTPGQYLVFWPEGTVTRYGPPLSDAETAPTKAEPATLNVGEHSLRFGVRGGAGCPLRVRVMIQPPERHEIPTAATKPAN